MTRREFITRADTIYIRRHLTNWHRRGELIESSSWSNWEDFQKSTRSDLTNLQRSAKDDFRFKDVITRYDVVLTSLSSRSSTPSLTMFFCKDMTILIIDDVLRVLTIHARFVIFWKTDELWRESSWQTHRTPEISFGVREELFWGVRVSDQLSELSRLRHVRWSNCSR